VGIFFAIGSAHYLKDEEISDFKLYMFVLISLLVNCLADGAIYLTLTDYFRG
jgi:hypothetical protein